jgi:mannitol operon repressor
LIEGQAQEKILSGFTAPIGSLSAKITLASALALINERERCECNLIRKIRNKFAHIVHPSFDDESVKSLCSELSFRAMPYDNISVDAKGSLT